MALQLAEAFPGRVRRNGLWKRPAGVVGEERDFRGIRPDVPKTEFAERSFGFPISKWLNGSEA